MEILHRPYEFQASVFSSLLLCASNYALLYMFSFFPVTTWRCDIYISFGARMGYPSRLDNKNSLKTLTDWTFFLFWVPCNALTIYSCNCHSLKTSFFKSKQRISCVINRKTQPILTGNCIDTARKIQLAKSL